MVLSKPGNKAFPIVAVLLRMQLLWLLLLSGCITSVVSPQMESEAGADMAQEVNEQIGLYRDAPLERYVSAVGARLVTALGDTPYTFHFAIVDQHQPNAFASLGGYVYISRGLLVQLNSEAELAGVLAHEISHVTRRHHTRQVGRSMGAGLLTLPGRAVGVVSEDLGNMINKPVEVIGSVYLSSYSRSQETEADDYGLALAARAGYDPLALVSALEGLERSVAYFTGATHEQSFFDSHPTTPSRVADITRRTATIRWTPSAAFASDGDMARLMDGVWWGPQNPQQGMFKDEVYLNADMNFRIAFPTGWETANTPRFVAGSAADGGAYLALGSGDPAHTIEEQAEALVARMRERASLEPAHRERLMVGGWPAQLIRYDDNSGAETVSLYYLYVASSRGNFTAMSMGYEHHREALKTAVLSVRPLNQAERSSLKSLRVKVATAKSGENLTVFNRRVANFWTPELTAIVNGLNASTPLSAGKVVKLAREDIYRPENTAK